MTRAKRFATAAGGATVLYVLLLLNILPTPLVSQEARDQILPTLPWWALVSTGSYLLWNMGWGIFNFNDVPQAYQELMVDIKSAKDYLRERGVDVDS
ncbi:unnamed protein product [Tilletia controversa]|uniref:Dolichol-phosphate mannosyltransferase subunit 3 n=3 Tax=Tilletia TaxID=13289 RepID=A0A8X7MSC5_9BASI|nr:hypothetical protein CF336_g4195 [Tilletia laevis]KAE8197343.1 hypothetical protein CF328_g3878 [Tilletia controversa]KAE8261154.1 hypothetical protein A4X03_0g3494 [Tilletia caries]KAE8205189.1 hypothetical protein CF335_g2390 [Tilletia laevis]KAE8247282.1 hypothetical protein A4X06_0g4569 [Tilletia controversa]